MHKLCHFSEFYLFFCSWNSNMQKKVNLKHNLFNGKFISDSQDLLVFSMVFSHNSNGWADCQYFLSFMIRNLRFLTLGLWNVFNFRLNKKKPRRSSIFCYDLTLKKTLGSKIRIFGSPYYFYKKSSKFSCNFDTSQIFNILNFHKSLNFYCKGVIQKIDLHPFSRYR